MKRRIAMLLATALCLCAAGCGSAEDTEKEAVEEEASAEAAGGEEEAVAEAAGGEEAVRDADGEDGGGLSGHLYTISGIRSDSDELIVTPGTARRLWIESVTVWDLEEGGDMPVYTDPKEYTDAESLAEDGYYLAWGTFDAYNLDGLNMDAIFEDDAGFAVTVTYPGIGSYRTQLALTDACGNVLKVADTSEVTVVSGEEWQWLQ